MKKSSVKKAAPKKSAKKPPAAAKPVQTAAKPAAAAPRPAASAPVGQPTGAPQASPPSTEERRKAATRRFFARLRSLEAIIGADLRKRGSVVLMQAVDQWYHETTSATATDVSITNAAKAVIAHL